MDATFVSDVLLPMVVFILMLIVGTDLRPRDIGTVRAKPRAFLVCLATQILVIPAVALALVNVIEPVEFMALGVVFLSICPSGALSNLYVYFGRGDVALSVALTVVGILVYVVAFPLLAAAIASLNGIGSVSLSLPIGTLVGQLVVFLLVPVVIGILVRRFFPEMVEQRRRLIDGAAVLLLAVTVSVSAWIGRDTLVDSLFEIAAMAALFTVAALAAGSVTSLLVPRAERSACVTECAVRNIPIAIIVVKDVLDSAPVIGFFVGYFLVHAPILLAYNAASRLRVSAR